MSVSHPPESRAGLVSERRRMAGDGDVFLATLFSTISEDRDNSDPGGTRVRDRRQVSAVCRYPLPSSALGLRALVGPSQRRQPTPDRNGNCQRRCPMPGELFPARHCGTIPPPRKGDASTPCGASRFSTWPRDPAFHRFRPTVQFRRTVSGRLPVSGGIRTMRNRWPSAATSKSTTRGNHVRRIIVTSKSGRG